MILEKFRGDFPVKNDDIFLERFSCKIEGDFQIFYYRKDIWYSTKKGVKSGGRIGLSILIFCWVESLLSVFFELGV